MGEIIGRYSPNIRWGKQKVELTLKQWDYAATHIVHVRGNSMGFDVIDGAVSFLYNHLAGDGSTPASVVLSKDGDTLRCEDDEELGEEWLKKMVVSASIIAWEAPTLNEVRALNGAKPVKNGDQPWDPN